MSKLTDVMERWFAWLATDWTRLGWINVGTSVAMYILYKQVGPALGLLDFASNVLIGSACYCFGAGHVTRHGPARMAASRHVTMNVSTDEEVIARARQIVAERNGRGALG